LIEDDILNNRRMKQIIDKCEVIFHCAAQTPTQHFVGASHIFEQNNHWGTAVLADCLQVAKENKCVVNLSTLAVYGDCEIRSLDQQPNPTDFYGISKVRSERQIENLADNSFHKVVNVRIPIVFGYSKNLRIDQVINRIVFDAKMSKRVQVFGNHTIEYPHIYMRDLIAFLASCIYRDFDSFTVIPEAQSIAVVSLIGELEERVPDLETVFVDQGAYASKVGLHKKVETISIPRVRDSLGSQLSEFLGSFII
jgi:UDP-glucose 4-epimerase